uniref:DH domain-containing protein n=1 Tax=Steinernema glaseri TaxID=37863 RepID=A0A1I7YDJ1_9BILA
MAPSCKVAPCDDCPIVELSPGSTSSDCCAGAPDLKEVSSPKLEHDDVVNSNVAELSPLSTGSDCCAGTTVFNETSFPKLDPDDIVNSNVIAIEEKRREKPRRSLGVFNLWTKKRERRSINMFTPIYSLVQPKWDALGIWDPPPSDFSGIECPRERKKQETIQEIYTTETHHCQVLIFLQQVCQTGLKFYDIIPETDVKELVPDVLDSLLEFHLSILRRIRERRDASPVVSTVSDIICDEFSDGPYSKAALKGYTQFCLQKNKTSHKYDVLMAKKSRFRKYFKLIEGDPCYRNKSFKSCLLLIAQRPTKYSILLDQLIKHEAAEYMGVGRRALDAVRSFARQLNDNLESLEIEQRWIQRMLITRKSTLSLSSICNRRSGK